MGDNLVFCEIYKVLLFLNVKKQMYPIYFLSFVCYNQGNK